MSHTPCTDFTDELKEAIRTLEEFARQPEETIKPIQNTISLIGRLIFSNKREKRNFSDEVLKAIEVVNRKRFLIQKLQKNGNPAEKKLAGSFLETINVFNAKLDKTFKVEPQKGIAKFFSKDKKSPLFKIGVPLQKTIQQHYPENSSGVLLSRKISSMPPTASKFNIHFSKQFKELFHMKVIALLERFGVASNREARLFVKSSPIETAISDDQSKCILTQTINLFPGQTIVIKGSSELDPQTQTISRLFPETFYLLLQSTQTGFPHPSQRAGWSLSSQLISDSPQRPDLLSYLAPFYQFKKQVVQELGPKGRLVEKAKKIIRLKREAFNLDRQAFTRSHQQLATAIVRAAPAHLITVEAACIIERFFSQLEYHPSPFDYLSETHHLMADLFIDQPHAKLMEAIMQSAMLSDGEAQEILTVEMAIAMQKCGERVAEDTARLDYIALMGTILGHASKTIMLQYLSEDLVYNPPSLNLFEQKLQVLAYRHAADFLNELSDEWSEDPQTLLEWASQNMREQIDLDSRHWTSSESHSIANELDSYFKQRFRHLAQ